MNLTDLYMSLSVKFHTVSKLETDALKATWGAKNCNFSNSHVDRFVGFFLALPLADGFLAFT